MSAEEARSRSSTKRGSKRTRWSVAFVAAVGFGLPAGAVVLHEHTGANDPLTEGWVEGGPFVQTTAGPVLDDQGSGIDAWFVDDDGTAFGDAGLYEGPITPEEAASGESDGWALTTRLRSVDVPDPAPGAPPVGEDAAPFLAYRDGTTTWQLHFQTEDSGDLTVFLGTNFDVFAGLTHTIVGGAPDYHLLELVLDPGSGLAALSVDGSEIIADYPGASLVTPAPVVLWGSGDSDSTGQGNFNLVRFELVPEPTASLLLAVGAGVLCAATRLRLVRPR
jgi:hypothetical protein